MFKLTIECEDLEQLTTLVGKLGKIRTAEALGPENSKAHGKKEKVSPVAEVAEDTPTADAVTYADVKAAVLEVAKTKGRDASLDVLAGFGVVKGEGKERTGDISSLTEDQYEAVVVAAKKALV